MSFGIVRFWCHVRVQSTNKILDALFFLLVQKVVWYNINITLHEKHALTYLNPSCEFSKVDDYTQ